MRELTSHKVSGLNDELTIQVLDEPGQGGACHKYQVFFRRDVGPNNPAGLGHCGLCFDNITKISFQNGPIRECGVNGISNEALLAIVEDRLTGFQSGEFFCRENANALEDIQEAMMWLHKRTLARGAEGTNQK